MKLFSVQVYHKQQPATRIQAHTHTHTKPKVYYYYDKFWYEKRDNTYTASV